MLHLVQTEYYNRSFSLRFEFIVIHFRKRNIMYNPKVQVEHIFELNSLSPPIPCTLGSSYTAPPHPPTPVRF